MKNTLALVLMVFGSFGAFAEEITLRCECYNNRGFGNTGYFEKPCKGLISVKINEGLFSQSFTVVDGLYRNVRGKTTFGENFIEWRLKESFELRAYTLERNGLILRKGLTIYNQQGRNISTSFKEHKCNRVDGL